MKFSKSKLDAAVCIAMRSPRPLQFRDGLLTFDQATIDSAGAFLIGELERLDQTLNMPLAAYTWSRDIDLRTDVSMGDEASSFTNSSFGASTGAGGSGKAWISKTSNAISTVGIDIGKTPQPLTLWGMQVGWTLPELESAQKLGRSVDSQKYEAMQLKYNMDVDEQVYVGDATLGFRGLLNHTAMPVSNAQTGNWGTATPAQMIADVNELLNSAWQNSGYSVCPETLLLPPAKFSKLGETLVSSAGTQSVLEYLVKNCISNRVNGKPLDVRPLKWLTGTTNGNPQGPGAAGADRMVAYTKQKRFVRFPLVPMQRTPLEYRDIRQLTTYFCRFGVVELVYPETIAARDGI
jgi:hypothetical protein